jgi:hypothetical protein
MCKPYKRVGASEESGEHSSGVSGAFTVSVGAFCVWAGLLALYLFGCFGCSGASWDATVTTKGDVRQTDGATSPRALGTP